MSQEASQLQQASGLSSARFEDFDSHAESNEFLAGTASMSLCLIDPSILDLIPDIPSEKDSKQIIHEVDELIHLFRLGSEESLFSLSDDEVSSLYAKKAMQLIYLKELDAACSVANTAYSTLQNGETSFVLGCAQYCVG